MRLVVNGKKVELDRKLTVRGLLSKQNVRMPEMVSVEVNGRILKRSEFENITLNEGDTVEFLYFMGGGLVLE